MQHFPSLLSPFELPCLTASHARAICSPQQLLSSGPHISFLRIISWLSACSPHLPISFERLTFATFHYYRNPHIYVFTLESVSSTGLSVSFFLFLGISPTVSLAPRKKWDEAQCSLHSWFKERAAASVHTSTKQQKSGTGHVYVGPCHFSWLYLIYWSTFTAKKKKNVEELLVYF